jgi:hypothetical protein
MKRWPVVSVFAWAVAAAMASGASVSELAPPGTKVAAGIDVRGLLNSSLAKDLADEVRGTAAMLASQPNLAGFDPLKDVDRVLILVTNTDDKAPALVIVSGRFDLDRLARGAKRYHDVAVIEDAKDPNSAIGLIDSETAILGNPAQVHAAIDRRGSGAQLDADLLSRMEAAWSRYDVWGMGDGPGPAATGEAADALRSVDRFSFGVALRQGLELTAEIRPRSSEDGAKIMTALSMIEMALKARQPKDSATKFDLDSDHGTLRIAVTVPEGELRKGIEAQRTSMVAAVSKRVQGARPATAPPNAPEVTLPVLEATAPPAPWLVPVAPKPTARFETRRPEAKAQIVTAPNGDTLFVRLPGAR